MALIARGRASALQRLWRMKRQERQSDHCGVQLGRVRARRKFKSLYSASLTSTGKCCSGALKTFGEKDVFVTMEPALLAVDIEPFAKRETLRSPQSASTCATMYQIWNESEI